MKHLRETFTDQEFADLKQAKDESGLNWHDYLLSFSQIGETMKTLTTYCAKCHEPILTLFIGDDELGRLLSHVAEKYHWKQVHGIELLEEVKTE